jgi:hypothetical protein
MDLYIESLYGSYEMQPVRKLSFPEKLAICVLERNSNDLMKFSLEQLCLCGSVLLKQRNGEMSATAFVLGILLK